MRNLFLLAAVAALPFLSPAWATGPCKPADHVSAHHGGSVESAVESGLLLAPPTPPSDLNLEALRTWLKQNWFDGLHTDLGYNAAREQL